MDVVLHNLIPCIGICNSHHSRDKELFHHHKGAPSYWPFIISTLAHLPIPPTPCPLVTTKLFSISVFLYCFYLTFLSSGFSLFLSNCQLVFIFVLHRLISLNPHLAIPKDFFIIIVFSYVINSLILNSTFSALFLCHNVKTELFYFLYWKIGVNHFFCLFYLLCLNQTGLWHFSVVSYSMDFHFFPFILVSELSGMLPGVYFSSVCACQISSQNDFPILVYLVKEHRQSL